MDSLKNIRVLVIGFGQSGMAATELLLRRGANVVAIDEADTAELRTNAAKWRRAGATVRLASKATPEEEFDLAVISPGVSSNNPIVQAVTSRGVPLISELELGYQQALCLNAAVTGTNGKTTTTELIQRVLESNQVKTMAAGNIGVPLTSVVEQTRELDVLTLEVSSFQLEHIQYFRPAVAVLLNITPDHLDRYGSMDDYVRTKARIFMNQQAFDFAVIQSEALKKIQALNIEIPSKIVTFSASDRDADIHFDRELLISRMPDWSGPLLDMAKCKLRGPHNAENLMAALAVGRAFRVPLEVMVPALTSYAPAAHRCEVVAEVKGVAFINDSKATNVDALHKALLSTPTGAANQPNVWLIAGGKDKGFDYHDIGPLLAQRVKGAFLIGETREKIRAAWSLFIPCSLADSLLEAVTEAARCAAPGDVVLLSPACSSFDQFQNYQERGEIFRQAVTDLQNKLARERTAASGSRPQTQNLKPALAFL
jgi:UDP-N-acetylmuramoylalanine--D-glutamate ligase